MSHVLCVIIFVWDVCARIPFGTLFEQGHIQAGHNKQNDRKKIEPK